MGKAQDDRSDPPVARPDEISLLMDGELDPSRVESVCLGLRDGGCAATWVCFHMIGDALRGSTHLSPGFSIRFAERLAVEPTVIAPQRREARPLATVWAVAATLAAITVVGWVAVQTISTTQPTVIMTARQSVNVRPVDSRPAQGENEYVLAHQEYSPTTAIQDVGPRMRAVTATEGEARP